MIYSAAFSLVGAKLREKSNRGDVALSDFIFFFSFLRPSSPGYCRGPEHRLCVQKQRPKLSLSRMRSKTTSQKYRASFEQGSETSLDSQQLIPVSLVH